MSSQYQSVDIQAVHRYASSSKIKITQNTQFNDSPAQIYVSISKLLQVFLTMYLHKKMDNGQTQPDTYLRQMLSLHPLLMWAKQVLIYLLEKRIQYAYKAYFNKKYPAQ